MKYDFWMDLPLSLIELGGSIMTKEDNLMASVIQNSNMVFNIITIQKYREIFNQNNLLNFDLHNSSKDELQAIKHKIFELQKEKTQLLCKSIKFCTKIMTKILNSIERVNDVRECETGDHSNDPVDVLTRTKLFLKITRLVVDHANKQLAESNGQQLQFFTMIKVFTEKIQSRLYSISNELIKNLMKNARRTVCNEGNNNIVCNKETLAMKLT